MKQHEFSFHGSKPFLLQLTCLSKQYFALNIHRVCFVFNILSLTLLAKKWDCHKQINKLRHLSSYIKKQFHPNNSRFNKSTDSLEALSNHPKGDKMNSLTKWRASSSSALHVAIDYHECWSYFDDVVDDEILVDNKFDPELTFRTNRLFYVNKSKGVACVT